MIILYEATQISDRSLRFSHMFIPPSRIRTIFQPVRINNLNKQALHFSYLFFHCGYSFGCYHNSPPVHRATVKPQYIMWSASMVWGFLHGGVFVERLLPECGALTAFHIVSVGVLTVKDSRLRKLFYVQSYFLHSAFPKLPFSRSRA